MVNVIEASYFYLFIYFCMGKLNYLIVNNYLYVRFSVNVVYTVVNTTLILALKNTVMIAHTYNIFTIFH